MNSEPTENTELEKLLQELKRNIKENELFLETLQQEPFSDSYDAAEEPAEAVLGETFEEL